MPVPGEPRNVTNGKREVVKAIEATFPRELFPLEEWQLRYHLYPFPLAGSGVDVLYRPNSTSGPSVRTRRPVVTYLRDFPHVEVLVCDEDFRGAADALLAYLNGTKGISAREIRRIPYWCNWGAGNEKPSSYLD